jgi:hypothetical protein
MQGGLRRRVSIRLGEPVRFPSMTSVPLRVLLHRVAEATLKDFLDRVGRAITLSQTGGAETMCS